MAASSQVYALDELNKETTFGGAGRTKSRAIPQIDMNDFAARKREIADQLWQASTEIGFFQLINHGIPQQQIDEAFLMTERFFALPQDTKAQFPMRKGTNAGWEYRSQVRPSTGTADEKESYQITTLRMAGLWPTGDELPGFKAAMLAFERVNWALGMKVLSCFALRLGFATDFFTELHDPLAGTYQSTLRLLHYLPMLNAQTRRFRGLACGRPYRLRLPDVAAPAHRPGRVAALPWQGIRGVGLDRCRATARRRDMQHRRHVDALERRQAPLHAASGTHAQAR